MPRRRELRGIANGLLGTFVSRNNDIDGYWGLGVLRRLAEKLGTSSLTIHLLTSKQDDSVDAAIKKTQSVYRNWLYETLGRIRIPKGWVVSAKIAIQFATSDGMPKVIRDTRGDPYLATAVIVDNLGHSYEVSKYGYCAPHDPNREYRSTRIP